MAEEVVSLEFLSRQQQRLHEEMRTLRKEVADIRTLSLQTYDSQRRLERRVNELKDDFEVMLKAELMGSLTHLETKLEILLQPVLEKVPGLDRRVAEMERKG